MAISTTAPARIPVRPGGPPPTVDEFLAGRRLSRWQFVVVAVCTLAAFVDGADRQSVGLVARSLARDLHLDANALGLVFSVDNLGAVVGAIVGGYLVDRFGRRPVLLASLALIAVCTAWTGGSHGFGSLTAARLIAGVGLGAAIPAFLTLACEFVAPQHRGVVAALVYVVGYPLGGAVGGVWTSYLLAQYTWQSVFYVGAAVTVVVLLLTWSLVPESLHHLARSPGRASGLHRVATRVDKAFAFQTLSSPVRVKGSRGSLQGLFTGGLAGPTLLLWAIYLFLFATVKVTVTWLPSFMAGAGVAPSDAALSQSVFFVCSMSGGVIAFYTLERIGVKKVLVASLVLVSITLALIGARLSSLTAVNVLIALHGLGIGLSSSAVIAVNTVIYPDHLRGTGVGAGMAASRLGQVASPLVVSLFLSASMGSDAILLATAVLPLLSALFTFAMPARPRGAVPAASTGPA